MKDSERTAAGLKAEQLRKLIDANMISGSGMTMRDMVEESLRIEHENNYNEGYQTLRPNVKCLLIFGPGMGKTFDVAGQNGKPQPVVFWEVPKFTGAKFESKTPWEMPKRDVHTYDYDDTMSSAAEAEDVALYVHSVNCACIRMAEEAEEKRRRAIHKQVNDRYADYVYGDPTREPLRAKDLGT